MSSLAIAAGVLVLVAAYGADKGLKTLTGAASILVCGVAMMMAVEVIEALIRLAVER